MTDLAQAVRDAIDALRTPMPREVIAEQLKRALEVVQNKSVTTQYGSEMARPVNGRGGR